jgi:small subunit ribosomal protein S17
MEQQEQDATPAGTPAAKPRRRSSKTGVVLSDKMQKTVVVAVQRLVRHPLYHKTMRRTSTFMAHDEQGAKPGDTVRIEESRPLSRRKRWVVAEILTRAVVVEAPTETASRPE